MATCSLVLSSPQKRKLQDALKKSSLPQSTHQRCHVLLLLHEKKSPTLISQKLNLSRTTIYTYLKQYHAHGLDFISEKKKKVDRQKTVTPEKIKSILHRTLYTSPKEGKFWSTRKIAKLENVSHESVWKVWKEHHINPKQLSSQKKELSSSNPSSAPPHSKSAHITIHDIAQKAKVSKATVSLALRNHPSISLLTRKKIKKIAKSLNYFPDASLRNLTQIRWKNQRTFLSLAYITTKPSPLNSFLFKKAQQEASQLGYVLENFYLQNYSSPHVLSRILINRGIQGLILNDLNDPDGMKEQFNWRYFSVVTCFQFKFFTHKVGLNRFAMAQLAWEKIQKIGYQRIGIIVPLSKTIRKVELIASIQYQQSQIPEKRRIPIFIQPPWEKEGLFQQWVTTYQPDVLLFDTWKLHHDDQIRKIRSSHFPHAVISRSEITLPHISGSNTSLKEIAATAIRFLSGLIRNNEYGLPKNIQRLMTPITWHKGTSLNPDYRHHK